MAKSDLPDPDRSALDRLRALIADDAFAATFQTMGQYRSALLQALAVVPAPQPAPEQDRIATLEAKIVELEQRLWFGEPRLGPRPETPKETEERAHKLAEILIKATNEGATDGQLEHQHSGRGDASQRQTAGRERDGEKVRGGAEEGGACGGVSDVHARSEAGHHAAEGVAGVHPPQPAQEPTITVGERIVTTEVTLSCGCQYLAGRADLPAPRRCPEHGDVTEVSRIYHSDVAGAPQPAPPTLPVICGSGYHFIAEGQTECACKLAARAALPSDPGVTQPTTIAPREATWGPEYQAYHVHVVEAIRARLFARWPPKTVEERRTLERNLRFFDECCDYLEEFSENVDPMEMADDQIDAAS